MKNELLHFFVPEKGRRTKRQPISWLCCWAILLGIVCNACSDDDPVKKNPYLQVSTRALLKEVVEVKFNNIDGNTDITVETLVNEMIAKTGENIIVRRFARFQLGEEIKS